MDAAISTATLIRYALTTLGIFALIFLLTLLTPWMAKKVDAWIARYRENHSGEKNETYGVHSIYELPPEKTEKLPEKIPQDEENRMLDEVSEEAWKEEKPIVPEVDWFDDEPLEDASETKRLFPKLDVSQQQEDSDFYEDEEDFEEDAPLSMEESEYEEFPDEFDEEEDAMFMKQSDDNETPEDFEEEDDPMLMRKSAYDEVPEKSEVTEPEIPPFMNICGLLSGEPQPTYPPEGLEMATSTFYEEPYPQAVPKKKPAPVVNQVAEPVQEKISQPEPVPESMSEPEPVSEEAQEEITPELVQPVKVHAKKEEVDALLGRLIDKEKTSFRQWEADPYDEEAEELDEEDFEYDDDDIEDDDEEDYDDEGWFRPAQ